MVTLTKIFHFEMAHAIHGYAGSCQHIHGHSYKLHVSISSKFNGNEFLPAPGFLIDFKEIKKLVPDSIIKKLDHRLVLSKDFLEKNPTFSGAENLLIFEAEPSAENLLFYISTCLTKTWPENIGLAHLKLYETKDSYAEWSQPDLSN